jgi:hypothetical protein
MYLVSAMDQRAVGPEMTRVFSLKTREGKRLGGVGGDEAIFGQEGDMTYCPARSDPVAKPSPPHIELIIPALDVEVLTTTVKYTGLSSALIPIESILRTCKTSIISITPTFRQLTGDLQKHHSQLKVGIHSP